MNYHFTHLLSAPPPPPFPLGVSQIPGLFGNYPKPLDTRSNRNNVLQIRNLSPSVAYAERDHLFYGLGATSVHNYPFYTIVYMHNETACHSVIRLLHQRLWPSTSGSSVAECSGTNSKAVPKRLRVEFLPPNQSESRIVNAHTVCDSSLKKLIRTTQEESFRSSISSSPSTSSSSTLPQPQPNNHEYSCSSNFNFPPPTPSVIRRIGRHLGDNPRFYHHVLLLMIKLKLRPPFDEDNPHDSTFDDSLILEDIPLPTETLTFDRTKRKAHDDLLGSDESELEDDNDDDDLRPLKNKESYQHEPKRRRVTKGLRVGLVGERILPDKSQSSSKIDTLKANPKVITTSIEEVFDSTALKPKILEIKVQRSTTESITPTTQEKESTEEVAVPEPFGTLQPTQSSTSKESREPKKAPPSTFDLTTLTEEELISDLDLKQNRLKAEEYAVHSAFRGYEVGERNRCLRVKNLNDRKPFAMVQRELYRLFGRFVELYNEAHLDCFNIVYMNKGRMHGQAFVTFPTEELAERALADTHGYVMFNRPMVVSFSNSKKAIET